MLIQGMTADEIRVLQEFRRVTAESLPMSVIKTIKHPAGGGEAPALSLLTKGFLTADASRETFTLTSKAKEFLSYDPKPDAEEAAPAKAAGSE